MADIPESTKSEHVVWTVDATSYLRNLDSEDLGAETIAVHHQSAPEKTETGTRISLRFPTLIVSGYCSEPREVADRVARILNAHWDEPAAPPAMDREAVARIIDPTSFCDVPYTDDPIMIDMVKTWQDTALAKADAILSTLSADAIRQGEGATARNCRVVPDGWKLVPIEPTRDMIRAGMISRFNLSEQASRIWRDMLAATPASHASDGGKV